MKKKSVIIILTSFSLLLIGAIVYAVFTRRANEIFNLSHSVAQSVQDSLHGDKENTVHPLQIEQMRAKEYPGSEILIEETLSSGANFQRYLVSYFSEGNKIYALLEVPAGKKPSTGWPVIIFNHGYIAPEAYRTTERYLAYTATFARNGYIVLKPDYRGHGNSEGEPTGAYYSPAYTTDVLNALSSIKKYPNADPNRIGMWGHSMGGHITLRSMVVSNSIKAGVIWAGVVVSYEDMINKWTRKRPWSPSLKEQQTLRPRRQDLIDQFGSFEDNPEFWHSIAPIYYVEDISGPVQIHHGSSDEDVPVLFSELLQTALEEGDKEVELLVYEGDDHNISKNLSAALQNSVEFFDTHLKNE